MLFCELYILASVTTYLFYIQVKIYHIMRKKSSNSDGQQFPRNQQNERLPLTSLNTHTIGRTTTYGAWNLGPVLGQAHYYLLSV